MTTRRCLLLLAGSVLLFGLLGQVLADKPAKPAVPEYLYVPGYMGLASKDVQKEVGLTEEQVQKLKEISKGLQQTGFKQQPRVDWAKLTEEQRKKKTEEYRKEYDKWAAVYKKRAEEAREQADAVLTPEQKAKLQVVELRMFAAPMVLNGYQAEKLNLTAQQKEQLSEAKDKLQKRMAELQQQMQKAQAEANRAALKVLTPEQLEQLKKLRQEGYRPGMPGSVPPKK